MLLWPALAAVLLSGAAGCATVSERMAPAREAYESGRPAEAEAAIRALEADAGKDRPLLELERGSTLLALGRFEEAGAVLDRAASEMRAFEKEDLGEWVAAAFTDDTALAYEGDDHEKVLAPALSSVALLLDGRPDEARAMALQVNREQDRLRSKPVLQENDGRGRPGYRLFALGEWLQAVVDEQRGSFDEARIGYRRCVEYGFAPAEADLRRVEGRRLAGEEGRGAVVVLFLAGRGPVKRERVEPVLSDVFVIASAIHNARRGAGFPSQAPVVVPWLRARPSLVRALEVLEDGRLEARTETILDVDDVAERQMRDALPRAVLRAVCRRAFKEYAKSVVKGAVRGKRDDGWAGLLVDIGGWIWTASERADTRCWSLLPKRFQVARLELPEGVHRLLLSPYPAPAAEVEVRADPARIAFVLVIGPSDHLAPWVFVDPSARP